VTPAKIDMVQDFNANYLCDGDQPMHMRFEPFKAELQSQGVSAALVQQPAADGFLYAGGGQSVRARGHDATWTDGKGVVHQCHDVMAASPKDDKAAH
jgi:membrane-bound lysozyme inhibitor of c-type lysozyme MliC